MANYTDICNIERLLPTEKKHFQNFAIFYEGALNVERATLEKKKNDRKGGDLHVKEEGVFRTRTLGMIICYICKMQAKEEN